MTVAAPPTTFGVPVGATQSEFDAVAGIGMGAWIADANSLGAADRAAFARLLDAFVEPDAGYDEALHSTTQQL